MEQKATQEKMMKEYRTWFDIFKSQLMQSADRQKHATYPKIRHPERSGTPSGRREEDSGRTGSRPEK